MKVELRRNRFVFSMSHRLRTGLLLGVLLFCCQAVMAEKMWIYPVPQQFTCQKGFFSPVAIKIICSDSVLTSVVRNQLPFAEDKKGLPVYVGIRGERSVRKFDQFIPTQADGYYLSVSGQGVVVAGNDKRGVWYGLNTLSQLLQEGQLPYATIVDYPDVAFRGVVEGFYGQPWSHVDRLSLLEFFGDYKLNTYIYGPKDDPYHSCPHWRDPYPESEARQISELVRAAESNQVDFVWAVHPGQDIRWDEEDRELLLKKFEMMYDLGVRSFAVFFDDISGEGTDPEKQADLLNFLYDRFVSVKPEMGRLIICPTEYNKSWANPNPGTYLDILGDRLYPEIQVMWTGDFVMSDITVKGLEYINARLKRPAYIWWNFPVSDYVRNRLLLGSAYGLEHGTTGMMSGFVSNPMDKAEASKIAIYSVAGYGWNTDSYDAEREWENGIRALLPSHTEALHIFATHNSDPGPNGHRFRRVESEQIKPIAERFLERGEETDYRILREEYKKIYEAAKELQSSTENPALIEELSPWLERFGYLGAAGIHIFDLLKSSGSPVEQWSRQIDILNIFEDQYFFSKKNNPNSGYAVPESGGLVMQPLAERLFHDIGIRYYAALTGNSADTLLARIGQPVLCSNVARFQTQPLQKSENSISIAPILEVVTVPKEGYLGLQLPILIHSGNVVIDVADSGFSDWGKVEVSEDGKEWVECPVEKGKAKISISLDNRSVVAFRFRNIGLSDKEIRLRQFTVTSPELSGSGGNWSLALDADPHTGFLLKGTQQFPVDTTGGNPTTLTVLSSPVREETHRANISSQWHDVRVYGIDTRGTRHILGVLHDIYSVLPLPSSPDSIESLVLEGDENMPVRIMEIILK